MAIQGLPSSPVQLTVQGRFGVWVIILPPFFRPPPSFSNPALALKGGHALLQFLKALGNRPS